MSDHTCEAYGFTFLVADPRRQHSGFDVHTLGRHLSDQPLELVERLYDHFQLYAHRLPELAQIEDAAFEEYAAYREAHGLPPLSQPIRFTGVGGCLRDRVLARKGQGHGPSSGAR